MKVKEFEKNTGTCSFSSISNEDVHVIGYINVEENEEGYIAKQEVSTGLMIERILEETENLPTISQLNTIDEEEFGLEVVRNMGKIKELMDRMETCLLEGWPNPRNNHEDDAIEVIGGLIMTNKPESEDDLWGWRFAMFQEIGGPNLMRGLSTRFQLLQQARDVIRKVSRCLASNETSDDNKKRIRTLIQTTDPWAILHGLRKQ